MLLSMHLPPDGSSALNAALRDQMEEYIAVEPFTAASALVGRAPALLTAQERMLEIAPRDASLPNALKVCSGVWSALTCRC